MADTGADLRPAAANAWHRSASRSVRPLERWCLEPDVRRHDRRRRRAARRREGRTGRPAAGPQPRRAAPGAGCCGFSGRPRCRFPRCCGRTPVIRPTCHRCSSCPSSKAARSSRSSTATAIRTRSWWPSGCATPPPRWRHSMLWSPTRWRSATSRSSGPVEEIERWCRLLETVDPALAPGWEAVAAGLRARVTARRVPGGRARRLPAREHARGGLTHRGRRRLGDLVGR